ncbi:MAG TPA: deacetylase [Burkholderiales bacterium]|nr:deacetylase [Burkholderiales bacterium]
MSETPFIITIDTEGDDLWARPRQITTRNAAYLPRFQTLCERYGFKPVYLVNYEMAACDAFVEFGRDTLARGTAEIGMHLHAWNSPPLYALTDDDFRHQPFLIEYPAAIMKEKIRTLTALLEERFNRPMVSHRAGRWAFDGRYAAMLLDAGYRVDCSVTPGVNWSRNMGVPGGCGGSNYTAFPERPYFLSPADIAKPSTGALLEVPMTVRSGRLYRHLPWAYRTPVIRWALKKVSSAPRWLCPTQLHEKRNLRAMVQLAREARANGAGHLEFVMHSSELMPGGSPAFRDTADIETLYEQLEVLFDEISAWCRGMTLIEFDAEMRKAPGLVSPRSTPPNAQHSPLPA